MFRWEKSGRRKTWLAMRSWLKLYENIGGEYYSGEAAWEYVKEETGIDMKALFKNIGEYNM